MTNLGDISLNLKMKMNIDILFLALDATQARYMLSSCVRPSVRPSVTRRYCAKTAKPIESCKHRHAIAQGLWISDELLTGAPK